MFAAVGGVNLLFDPAVLFFERATLPPNFEILPFAITILPLFPI
jgi:hypothetical protein